MGKGKLIRKGAELIGGKKGSSAKPKTKGDKPNSKNGENAPTAKDAKGNIISRHPLAATGIGAAGLGTVGLGAYALTRDGNDRATLGRQNTGGSSGGTASSMTDAIFGDGSNPFTGSGNGGIIEIDPEVLTSFAAELARLGDAALAAADSAPDAFDALALRMCRDQLGSSTRSGGPSPVMADMAQALNETRDAYTENARSVAAQLHGDSQRLLTIIANHEEVEQSNAATINSVDTSL